MPCGVKRELKYAMWCINVEREIKYAWGALM